MEKKKIIVLGGLPGAGKSTVRDLLAAQLDYKTFYTGGFAREMAREKGMTLEELNEKVANDKSLDEKIDTEQIRIGEQEDRYVVDAHIGFHFIPAAFKVFLYTPLEIAAKRIFLARDDQTRIKSGDVANTLEEVLAMTQKRIDNHKLRYKKHYGIDVYDQSNFDLVVDTSHITPSEVVEKIIAGYKNWLQ